MSGGSAKNTERLPVFSFLAVLVCFMGCLLALLILIGAKAQAKATDIASDSEANAEATKEAAEVKELAAAQTILAQMRDDRAALAERLTRDRTVLAHLEDHTRRMRDQIEQQRMEVRQMARGVENQVKRETLTAEAARLDQLVADSTALLSETRDKASRKTSYSIIPYDGRHGTRRRPIYLECRADAVIFQPEGIILREDDFEDSLGPNSPLATALRAASEHVARQQTSGSGEQAYPLLIVRASGIRAYYAARAMLASWSEDFGYELVDDDWALSFPAADPKMARVLESAVTVARRRMQFNALARQATGAYGSPANRQTSGGAPSDTNEGVGSPSSGESVAASPGNVSSGNKRGGFGGEASTGNRTDRFGNQGGSTRLTGVHGGGIEARGPDSPGGQKRPGDRRFGSPGGFAGGTAGAGQGGSGPATSHGGRGIAGGNPGSYFGSGAGTDGASSSQPGPFGAAPSLSAGTHPNPQAGGPGQAGNAQGHHGQAAAAPRPGEVFVPTAGTRTSNASGAAGGSEASGSPPPGAEGVHSLAESRGENWALPGASQGSVGVTRPLRIEVAADRIVIDAGNPGGKRKEIACTGPTEAVIEQFVSNIWDQMRGWGIAGRGMYWRPVLNIHVMPDGQQRAMELRALLSDSGLDIKVQP